MPANVNKATNKLAERSQLALWATNAAIWDWDLEKILIWSSPGNQILFGRGDEEILESFDIDAAADPWISHLHPDDRERVRQHLRDHLKHGTLYDVEYRYRLPGGEYIWVRSIGRAVRASDGSPTRMAGSNSDITSQKIAELETQHFREAVDNASEGIVLYDSNERFVYANKRYREMAPAIAHLLTPGTHREKMRQAYLSSGAISSDAETADVFMEEMRRSQSVGGTAEIRLTNGLWMKRSDHVLPDGGTVSVRTDITHIKQQEQALRESEARFRTIFEDAKFGIVVANADGLLFQCNRAFSEMLGFDPGELDGKSWPEITNPEDLAENRRLSDRLLRGEIAIYQMEKRFIRKDGGLLWTHLTVSTVGDDDEQPQLRLGMIEDISERRAAEEALSKSRSLLVQAQEMAHLGNWEIDYDKNTVTWSDEIYRLLGLKRLEFDGQQSTFLNYVHPEDRERLAQQAKGLRKGSDLDHTYRLLRPDGQERIVHVQGVVTSEIDGVPRQSRGFIQDITESKRADEALRASLAHLNRAQRIAHIGSWEYYERDKKLVWTDEVYRIFGVRKDEFECTRENVLELLHPEDRSTMIEARKRAEKGETDYSYDYRIIRPDGQTRNLRNVVLVIARDGDGVVRRAGTVQDVTERVAAEKALRESETHLSGAQRIAHIGSWIHNRRTEDLSWSDEVYRIFGTTKKEFRPSLDRVLQLVHPDDRSKIIAARERATISDTGNSFVYRIIRPSGEIRYVRQLSRDLEQEGGEAIRRAGTVQDITEQENAEEALRNSEARLAKAQ
jgi:PAS domain S-box-containing protein